MVLVEVGLQEVKKKTNCRILTVNRTEATQILPIRRQAIRFSHLCPPNQHGELQTALPPPAVVLVAVVSATTAPITAPNSTQHQQPTSIKSTATSLASMSLRGSVL